MDDRKVYELQSLKLAYQKQLLWLAGLIIFSLMGASLYIFTVYQYNFKLLMLSIMMIITGVIGVMTIDQKLKLISRKIRDL